MHLAAANRAIAAFPPADLHLLTGGSVAENGDAGARFALFARSKLHLCQANPVGLSVAELEQKQKLSCLDFRQCLTYSDFHPRPHRIPSSWSDACLQALLACQILQAASYGLFLSTASLHNAVNVQWIPAHVGQEGSELANSETKQGSTLHQPETTLDYTTALQHSQRMNMRSLNDADARYDSDPHARVHQVFAPTSSLAT